MRQSSSRLSGLMIRIATGFALSAVSLAMTGCGPQEARSAGPGLSVAVVPPVERTVLPGETMEVGQLRDGFDRAALERAATTADDTYLPAEAYAGADLGLGDNARMPMPTPVGLDRSPQDAYRIAAAGGRNPRDRLDDGSPVFGFDRPRRDFAAERAARWAAREAHAVPESPPDALDRGPVPYTEVVKYSSE